MVDLSRLELEIQHLERTLELRAKPTLESLRELRQFLKRLHVELFVRARPKPATELHRAFHKLTDVAQRSADKKQLVAMLRDLRQYLGSLSSAARAHELEERLHELEDQLESAARKSAVAEAPPEDEKVVTLEGLKGKRVLFAIMPFHADFEDVWSGGIQRAASGTGLTPVRIDMITASTDITDEIVTVIEMAEIVVVDVTSNNANVMFEFGFALAKHKKQVVISQSTEFLTFDIKNVRTLIYRNSWRGIETLHKDLQRFIKGTLGAKKPRRKTPKKKASNRGA